MKNLKKKQDKSLIKLIKLNLMKILLNLMDPLVEIKLKLKRKKRVKRNLKLIRKKKP